MDHFSDCFSYARFSRLVHNLGGKARMDHLSVSFYIHGRKVGPQYAGLGQDGPSICLFFMFIVS